MKYLAHACLLLVGLGAAFLRWIDLVNYIDPETGFVLLGSVWLRYGAIALLWALSLAASFMAAKRPRSLEAGCIPSGILLALLGVLCAVYNAAAAYVSLSLGEVLGGAFAETAGQSAFFAWFEGIDRISALIALLGLACAAWLFSVALSQFGGAYHLPAGGTCLGVLGNLYFYGILISRFAANQSSYQRLDPTISVFAGAALIWFSTVLLRALYFPESAVGRKVYFAGMVCFYLCVGFTLPQSIYDLMLAKITIGAACENILFAGFGLLGALYATRALSKDIA